jgi:NAD(P)-dependent dehydrogenase (short-subunit alcohol dehydrogenase family)
MLAGDEGGPIRKSVEERTPVGRVGTPADIGGLVAYMCGPDGGFMTGSYVIIDGGLRDSGRSGMPADANDPRAQEMGRHFADSMQRRARLQRLLDER